MDINTINLQINNSLTLSSVQNFVDNSKFTFDVSAELNNIKAEEENAIVKYDITERSDVFYSTLSTEDKVIWDNFIQMCIIKVGITKDALAQIVIQYDETRLLINSGNVFFNNNNQYIIFFSELDNSETLIFNEYTNMITNIIL
jgi:hypothetical protein